MKHILAIAGRITGWGVLAAAPGLLVAASTTPPPQEVAAFQAIVAQDLRIATIGDRINSANLRRCSVHGLQPGFVLQAADQFPKKLRSDAERVFGLDEHVAVEAVVPGGLADRSGLRPGDAILSVGGVPTAIAQRDARDGRYDTVKAALDLFESQAAGKAALPLAIRRNGTDMTISLPVADGCAIRVEVVPSAKLNGSADDRYATITSGLAEFAADDDMMALFLGHEMAHAYLRHQQVLDGKSPLHAVLGRLALSPATIRETERQADHLGMILAANAGYDVSHASEAFQKLGDATKDDGFDRDHPGTAERVAEAGLWARQIAADKAAGIQP